MGLSFFSNNIKAVVIDIDRYFLPILRGGVGDPIFVSVDSRYVWHDYGSGADERGNIGGECRGRSNATESGIHYFVCYKYALLPYSGLMGIEYGDPSPHVHLSRILGASR